MTQVEIIDKAEIMRDKLASEGYFFSLETCILQIDADAQREINRQNPPIQRGTCE